MTAWKMHTHSPGGLPRRDWTGRAHKCHRRGLAHWANMCRDGAMGSEPRFPSHRLSRFKSICASCDRRRVCTAARCASSPDGELARTDPGDRHCASREMHHCSPRPGMAVSNLCAQDAHLEFGKRIDRCLHQTKQQHRTNDVGLGRLHTWLGPTMRPKTACSAGLWQSHEKIKSDSPLPPILQQAARPVSVGRWMSRSCRRFLPPFGPLRSHARGAPPRDRPRVPPQERARKEGAHQAFPSAGWVPENHGWV